MLGWVFYISWCYFMIMSHLSRANVIKMKDNQMIKRECPKFDIIVKYWLASCFPWELALSPFCEPAQRNGLGRVAGTIIIFNVVHLLLISFSVSRTQAIILTAFSMSYTSFCHHFQCHTPTFDNIFSALVSSNYFDSIFNVIHPFLISFSVWSI